MKICPKCDAQNANNAPVCKNCGANLNETPDVKPAEYAEEKPPYHLGLALLFFFGALGLSLLRRHCSRCRFPDPGICLHARPS